MNMPLTNQCVEDATSIQTRKNLCLYHAITPLPHDNLTIEERIHERFMNYQIIKCMINNGADVNAISHDGYSMLLTAISHKQNEIVDLFIQNGADIVSDVSICRNNNERFDISPIVHAVSCNNHGAVKLLLEYGADPHQQDGCGILPLENAIQLKLYDICKLLLEYGTDLHQRDGCGILPLESAIDVNSFDICKLLLEYGADPNQRDGFGILPLENATRLHRSNICELLLAHGAIPLPENK